MVETEKRASVVVRVDSGSQIGAGQLMRCLSLSLSLPATERFVARETEAADADWLGALWERDSEEVASILHPLKPAWLVVDHHAVGHASRPTDGVLRHVPDHSITAAWGIRSLNTDDGCAMNCGLNDRGAE